MATKVQVLRGGTRNGEEVSTPIWQPVIYLPLRLSFEEMHRLKIDETTCWKAPEEVYVRVSPTCFEYDRTVHYNPADIVSID